MSCAAVTDPNSRMLPPDMTLLDCHLSPRPEFTAKQCVLQLGIILSYLE